MTTIKNTFEQQLHQKFGVNVMSTDGYIFSYISSTVVMALITLTTMIPTRAGYSAFTLSCKRLSTHTAGNVSGKTAKC